MHFTSLFIIASTFFSIVFALPVAVPKDQSLSKSSTDVGSDVIPPLARQFEVESDELLDRDISDLFRRSNNQMKEATKYISDLFKSHIANIPEILLHIPQVGGKKSNGPPNYGQINNPVQNTFQNTNGVMHFIKL